MSPEKLLEVAERVEARALAEYRTTTDNRRMFYLERQIDRACVLRICSLLKSQGRELPSMRREVRN